MTENPARLLGIFEETGSIERGKTADLVVLDENMRVRCVYVAGGPYKEGEANEN